MPEGQRASETQRGDKPRDEEAAKLTRGCDDLRNKKPDAGIDRRRFIGVAALTAGVVALAGAGNEAAAFGKKKKKEITADRLPPQPSDRLVVTTGSLEGRLVRPEILELGAAPLTAYPIAPDGETVRRGTRLNRLLVLRLDAADMNEETLRFAVDGVVAYSALCTHKACTIKSWRAKKQHLRCHCHLSEFAPLQTGRVMAGPAKTPLPLLALALDPDGAVQVAEGFNRKPGAKTR